MFELVSSRSRDATRRAAEGRLRVKRHPETAEGVSLANVTAGQLGGVMRFYGLQGPAASGGPPSPTRG